MKTNAIKYVPLVFLLCVISTSALSKIFTPTVHITEQTQEDKDLLGKVRNLFFESTPSCKAKMKENKLYGNVPKDARRIVCEKSIRTYGAQEITLLTEDSCKISALYFKRPHAQVNIIYVTGYFHDYTPPKEWCSPFAQIFPEHNILAFDWRGFGDSEGENKFMRKNVFGSNAYPDIQAAIDFIKKDNDKPIILHGFCFGAAMAMYATLQARRQGKASADALGISCTFNYFEYLFNRAFEEEDRWYYILLLRLGLGKRIINYMMNGSLFDINPMEMIEYIDLPCWFDHYTNDPFAYLDDGIKLYEKKRGSKFFLQSDLGKHVRIHSKVPFQYQQAYNGFLKNIGFIS